MIVRRTGFALVVALLSALPSPPAFAEATTVDREVVAEALFKEAQRLVTEDHFDAACPKFAESVRLRPEALGAKFYFAECLEHTGKLASAWKYFLDVANASARSGEKLREKFARSRANALERRIPRLTIRVGDRARSRSGLEITRDEIPVGEPQWGVEVPVDLGAHQVHASAPGAIPWDTTVDMDRERQVVEVEIPWLASIAPVVPPPPPPPPRRNGQRIAGYVVGGVGLVGVGLGTFFGARAISQKNASNAFHCNATTDRCDATGLALRTDGLLSANLSTASFIVGGLALAGGLALVVTGPSEVSTSPAVTLGPQGISLTGRW